jgi:hypothetical protein
LVVQEDTNLDTSSRSITDPTSIKRIGIPVRSGLLTPGNTFNPSNNVFVVDGYVALFSFRLLLISIVIVCPAVSCFTNVTFDNLEVVVVVVLEFALPSFRLLFRTLLLAFLLSLSLLFGTFLLLSLSLLFGTFLLTFVCLLLLAFLLALGLLVLSLVRLSGILIRAVVSKRENC